jgi:hypothetical protein
MSTPEDPPIHTELPILTEVGSELHRLMRALESDPPSPAGEPPPAGEPSPADAAC